ncbi:MAG: extracellular solute-binding protein [Rhodospirillales bacterium]|nr:extracellular solute-binding protein [Rhodospirillales bacterium]
MARIANVAACVIVAAAFCLSTGVEAQQREVRISTWGGAQEDAQKKIAETFTKETGIRAVFDTWNGSLGPIRGMVQAKNVTTDTYPFNPWDAVAGCDEGILERLDPKELGLDPSDFYEGAIEPCGIASDLWTWAWAWNEDRHPEWKGKGPKNMAEIFDTQKFPGKRGFRKRVYAILEYGLMADGVPNKDVYKMLGTKPGVVRAYAKIEPLKKSNIVWLDTVAQMPQLLADGETDLTAIVNTRWYASVVHEKKNFGVMWRDQIYSYNMWAIPKGSPRLKETKEYLKYMLQPRKLADTAEFVAYAPARKSALNLVKEDIRNKIANAHFDNEIYMDARFWAENLDSFTKEFQSWLQK